MTITGSPPGGQRISPSSMIRQGVIHRFSLLHKNGGEPQHTKVSLERESHTLFVYDSPYRIRVERGSNETNGSKSPSCEGGSG